VNIQASISPCALVHLSGPATAVDQKDAVIALAATSATLAGFSLVFLGIVITRPVNDKKLRSDFRIVVGWILIFWLELLSAGCALAWLYLSAPGALTFLFLGSISRGFLYQSGWALLSVTALLSYYVVILTLRTVIRRDNKTADAKDDTSDLWL
jgi:hypothetical protein